MESNMLTFPLHAAVMSNNINVVRDLIAQGIDINAVDAVNLTALQRATEKNFVPLVALLLKHGASIDPIEYEDSALHIAASKGFFEIAKLLIVYGADINMLTQDGWTPLDLAISAKQYDIAQELIHAGAEVTRSENLTVKSYYNTPLIEAAFVNSKELVESLLMYGAVLDAQGQYGFTALHIAAKQGNVEIVKLLLAYGANAYIGGRNGKTAYMLALDHGHREIAQMLAEYEKSARA